MKLLLLLLLVLFNFRVDAASTVNYHQVANDFFQTYKERKDFEKFLTFYAEDVVFEDVFYQVNLTNKEQFEAFYDWHKGSFDRLDNQHILNIETIVIEQGRVVARGEFLPFRYDGKSMGPWPFAIWLEFNQEGKIIKQQDWINYSHKNPTKGN